MTDVKIENPGRVFLAFAVVLVASMPLEAWALSALWWWFVVPFGAPALGFAHAIGLAVLARTLRGAQRAASKEDIERWTTKPLGTAAAHVFRYPFAVLLGYCVHAVMT